MSQRWARWKCAIGLRLRRRWQGPQDRVREERRANWGRKVTVRVDSAAGMAVTKAGLRGRPRRDEELRPSDASGSSHPMGGAGPGLWGKRLRVRRGPGWCDPG